MVVGIYYDYGKSTQALIGKIVYAHLDTSVKVGPINRWGGTLGTVGSYKKVNVGTASKPKYCWTGKHIHVEAVASAACYWKGLKLNATRAVPPGEGFLGYVNYDSGACP